MVAGIAGIVEQLEQQKAAIETALAALREVGGVGAAESGGSATAKKRGRPAKRKGGVTTEGRERLRQAMKRRWAVKRAASATKKRRQKKGA